jgi:hypothetical protein
MFFGHWKLYLILIFAGVSFVLSFGVWIGHTSLLNGVCANAWLSNDTHFYLFIEKGENKLRFLSDSTYQTFSNCTLLGPNSVSLSIPIDQLGTGLSSGTIDPPPNLTSLEWRKIIYDLFSSTYLHKIVVFSQEDGNLTLPLSTPCKKPNPSETD